VVFRAGSSDVDDLVSINTGDRHGQERNDSGCALCSPQPSTRSFGLALVTAKLIEVFERELRVRMAIALFDDLSVQERAIWQVHIGERAVVFVFPLKIKL
jgi:hypothetical protein